MHTRAGGLGGSAHPSARTRALPLAPPASNIRQRAPGGPSLGSAPSRVGAISMAGPIWARQLESSSAEMPLVTDGATPNGAQRPAGPADACIANSSSPSRCSSGPIRARGTRREWWRGPRASGRANEQERVTGKVVKRSIRPQHWFVNFQECVHRSSRYGPLPLAGRPASSVSCAGQNRIAKMNNRTTCLAWLALHDAKDGTPLSLRIRMYVCMLN